MANATLLVPGTGGTTFVDNTGKDIGYPVKMRLGIASKGLLDKPLEEFVELLSMEHRPGQLEPVKSSLKPGTSQRPGHVLQVAYNQVPDSANHFLYDWRCDLRYSAGQLLDFLQQRQPSNGRWNLICHSQGGLLVVLASKLMGGREEFSELVASATLVAPPLAGTMNSFAALLDGDSVGKAAASRFKAVVRTFPSLYQMLPAWPAVLDGDGNAVPEDQQLTRLGGWDGLSGIDEDLLSRVEPVQEALRDPLSHLKGDVRVAVVLARNRKTVVEVEGGPGGLEDGKRLTQKGDSLVPYQKTLSWIGDHIKPYVIAFKSGVNKHAFMLNDPAVMPVVLRQLV